MIKVVVFDLDGTLADTANLELSDNRINGRRTPFDILKKYQPFTLTNNLWLHPSLKLAIANFIDCGVEVHIVTRSPSAYASTVCFLMKMDFHSLRPSSFSSSTSEKLRDIISSFEAKHHTSLLASEIIYIGDSANDAEAAQGLCLFQNINTMNNAGKENYLKDLNQKCEKAINCINSEMSPYDFYSKNYAENAKRFKNLISTSSMISREQPSVYDSYFNDWNNTRNVLSPVWDPNLFTMNEYSEVYELKECLKELAFRKGFYRSEIKKKYYSDMNGLLNDLKIYSYSEYMPSSANRYGGQGLWQLVKDWKIDHSNENTHLHYLDFVAQLMATGISASSEDFSIVPIPPHNFSKDHPGQVSLRLAERIAGYLNVPVELELERVESADYKFKAKGKSKEFKRIILIDDQITNGNTAYQAFKALQKMDYSQIELHTFTFSSSKWLRVHSNP